LRIKEQDVRNIMLTIALTGLLLLPASAAMAANVVDESIPFALSAYNPCNGEAVELSGRLHYLVNVTEDATGGYHLDVHANTQGVSGTGQATGAAYQVNYTDTFQLNVTNAALEATAPLHLNVIAQGQAPNFLLHAVFHIRVNATGGLTTYVDTFRVECR
jgi:opacity protein-like surface antigen